MLRTRSFTFSSRRCRRFASTAVTTIRPVPVLRNASLETFRQDAFNTDTPAVLPRGHFAAMPAVQKWFNRTPAADDRHIGITLNTAYLSKYGATLVPLEITNDDRFARIEQSLSFFLECVKASASHYRPAIQNRYFSSYVPGARAVRRVNEPHSNDFFSPSSSTLSVPTARIYLAQAPISQLPTSLARDVPTPGIVTKAGKGDVYDSSVWLGQAPTYTPLHCDPNPNLFVQLAGKKIIRLCRPEAGRALFAKVQEKIGGSASPTMRGEEMMQGKEKKALEEDVWSAEHGAEKIFWEAELDSGDGLYIPKGWWHSVKGVGKQFTGSVNWWFR